MKNIRWQSALFLILVVVVCGWILLSPLVDRVQSQPLPASTTAAGSKQFAQSEKIQPSEFAKWVAQGRALGALPASLEGTRVDGELAVDDQGDLVIDLGLRRVFDYFLATMGEETLDQIRARIALYLQQNLPVAAALQAWDVLTQYLNYKDALVDLPGHDGSYEGMKESLQQQRDMRDAMLGPELADAFFHEEDEYADFALEHIEHLRDPNLTAQEKDELTSALLNSLPDKTRALIEATGAPLGAEEKVETMREQGASENDVWQYREQQFGSAAADRLAQLDQQRQQWQQRYDAYRQQIASIQSSSLADQDKIVQIERLRGEYFSPVEQKRVAALDRIAAETRAAQ